jgi:hypothetical protein
MAASSRCVARSMDGCTLSHCRPVAQAMQAMQETTDRRGMLGHPTGAVDHRCDAFTGPDLAPKPVGLRIRLGMDAKDSGVVVDSSTRLNTEVEGVRRRINLSPAVAAKPDAVLIGAAVASLSMYMAIQQRTREIGILKSLGASKLLVLKIILLEALFLGLGGSILGIQNTNNTLDVISPNRPTTTINIKNLGVGTGQLTDNSVTSPKIISGAIDSTMSRKVMQDAEAYIASLPRLELPERDAA